jgi:hypothetical protein
MTDRGTAVLDAFVTDARNGQRRLTVYEDDEGTLTDLFGTGVTVEHRSLQGSAPYLTIEDDGEFVGAMSAEHLRAVLGPDAGKLPALGEVSDAYRHLLDLCEDVAFSAQERRQLLATSREIEDRAYRVGNGTLRVGFQRLSAFEDQQGLYRRLAAETALDVHVYGRPDWTPPAIEGVTYHARDDDTTRFWFLVFDGGAEETQACALVAREQDDGYLGRWTYDPETVADLAAAVESGD